MKEQISYCPFCGDEFENAAGATDSRSAAGFDCESCDMAMEMRVNRFPLA